MHFYPRPPRGGRPGTLTSPAAPMHFYPRPPRGGRLSRVRLSGCGAGISIHALREEGDETADNTYNVYDDFYPRPPRGGRPCCAGSLSSSDFYFYPRPPRGGRPICDHQGDLPGLFLSTPSARRATYCCTVGSQPPGFLSTPSARRATICQFSVPPNPHISIHALREEGDSSRGLSVPAYSAFLSTPSARRATARQRAGGILLVISIHALREEGDPSSEAFFSAAVNFYPRPPRGGRRKLREMRLIR